MKLVSFAIPCYNSAAYMRKCIESILPGGDEVEIIVVDDGSQKDDTFEIAKEYEAKYPGIVKAVHQENGGHGEAVNTGLRNASGLFYKVVDSDDWLDDEALPKVLEKLRELIMAGTPVDMFICNFIYDKVGQTHKKVMRYESALPKDRIFGWDEVKHFHLGQYILMHSVIYRTQMLRDCGLVLPKHTFYVDNIFVYQPIPSVEKMYYMDVNLYHYFIGRDDQSVNESVMIGRIDQQLKVNRIMIDCCDLTKLKSRKKRHYMFSYLEIITTISSVLAIKSGDPKNMQKKKELWDYLKTSSFQTWLKMRFSFLGQGCNFRLKAGNELTILCYKLAQKFYGFN